MLPTLAATQGPVALLIPNMGDDEITAQLTRVLAEKGLTISGFLQDEAAKAGFARANIFAVDRLTTGIHKTLDGRSHQVRCTLGGEGQGIPDEVCQIDDLTGANRLNYLGPGNGSVYRVSGSSANVVPFFRF